MCSPLNAGDICNPAAWGYVVEIKRNGAMGGVGGETRCGSEDAVDSSARASPSRLIYVRLPQRLRAGLFKYRPFGTGTEMSFSARAHCRPLRDRKVRPAWAVQQDFPQAGGIE